MTLALIFRSKGSLPLQQKSPGIASGRGSGTQALALFQMETTLRIDLLRLRKKSRSKQCYCCLARVTKSFFSRRCTAVARRSSERLSARSRTMAPYLWSLVTRSSERSRFSAPQGMALISAALRDMSGRDGLS